ncbi:MAG: class I SAM-dependent methyltransferase [archaeon]|jgi:ubiquinone/menaquinone biosynthesis C-methylase UbiE
MTEYPRGEITRSRGVKEFGDRFGKTTLTKLIMSMGESNKKVRLLEIGCGEGKLLVELAKAFPNIEIHGINNKANHIIRNSNSLITTALYYKIFTQKDIQTIHLPKLAFYNAEKIRFPNSFFDIIVSQVSIQFIKRKDKVIEEVWRCLKIGGIALLNIDNYSSKYPKTLQKYQPRFIVLHNNKPLSLKKFLQSFKEKEYSVFVQTKRMKKEKLTTNLIIKKTMDKTLYLRLILDKKKSCDLKLLDPKKEKRDIYWGYKSVFIA